MAPKKRLARFYNMEAKEAQPRADHYANICMDKKTSWQWDWQGLERIERPYTIQIFTDGGMRNERLASAAWVIFVLKQGHAKMVGNGALLLEQVDSYRAEIIAAKEGLHHANKIVNNQGRNEVFWPTSKAVQANAWERLHPCNGRT